jgi:TetR/AcrR family transcriptional repressor of mexCD-oprJ operon
MATPTHSRRDAERNHEAIVTAAIAVLADAPDATMAEIATASETGRSTLYRHFPDRAALVQAISVRIRSEARALVEQQLRSATADDAIEVLVTLADSLAGLGDRYRFLFNQDEQHRLGRGERRPDDLVGTFLARAHAAGTVRTDLDPDWLQQAYIYLMIAAVKAQFTDPDTQRDAIEKTVRSLLSPPVR